jgi:hypothetical protein
MASNGHHTEIQAVEVIPYTRTIAYPSVPEVPLPPKPEPEVRGGGLFGLGIDRQDAGHRRRLIGLHYLGVEVTYAEGMAVAIEANGIKASGEAVRSAEEIVYGHSQDSVSGMLTADLAGDMAARARARHARLAETYDAEAMNIIHRR